MGVFCILQLEPYMVQESCTCLCMNVALDCARICIWNLVLLHVRTLQELLDAGIIMYKNVQENGQILCKLCMINGKEVCFLASLCKNLTYFYASILHRFMQES